MADEHGVYDSISGRPRLNRDPVSDGGASRVAPGDGGGFHFDLGGALARLGGESPTPEIPDTRPSVPLGEPVVEPLPSRVRAQPSEQPPQPEELAEPLEPLPRRGDRQTEQRPAPEAPLPQAPPSSHTSTRRSVFDDVEPVRGPSIPTSVPAALIATPVVSRQAPVAPSAPDMHSSGGVATATLVAAAPVLAGGAQPFLPTLPPPTPVVTSMPATVVEPVATSTDLNALRAAQRRAGRQQRQGKVFGRTLLVLLGIGGLIAAALVFGRQYLYPTEWDAALTPIVDEIQTERGREFEHTVGLVQQPDAEYAQTVGRLAFDDAWLDSVPMWRALGLASGEPTLDSVGAALSPRRLAVYDPDADRVYLLAGADAAAADADLRIALEQAFAAQHGSATEIDDQVVTGFVGVSPRQQLVTAAVQDHIVGEPVDAAPPAAADPAATPAALPLPLEYEVSAIEHLGPGLLAHAGLDPAATTFQTELPDELAAALDDAAVSTGAGSLQAGDRSLAPPIALGNDDWSLVWGARLPEPSVDRLVAVVTADSYRTIDRSGVICVVGVFETGSASDAAFVLARMQAWAAAAPTAAQAAATAVGETRVQLVSCDPGAEAATSPIAGAADALVNRQLERLSP